MGNAVVNSQFHHLGVNHNELDILRPGFVEQTDYDGVHTYGFARTGCTGNEHMGHLRDISHNTGTANILAHRKRGLGFGLCKFRRINDFPQRNRGYGTVRDLNTNNGNLSGDGSNPNTGRTKAQRNIISTGCKLIQAYALIQLHLISGNTGTTGHVDDVGINSKAGQRFIQAPGVFPHFLCTIGCSTDRLLQKIDGRKAVWRRFLFLIARNFPGNLFRGSFCLFGCNLLSLPLLFRSGFRLFFAHKFGLLYKRGNIQLRHFRGSGRKEGFFIHRNRDAPLRNGFLLSSGGPVGHNDRRLNVQIDGAHNTGSICGCANRGDGLLLR